MRWIRMVAAVAWVAGGCASDPALQHARETVKLSGRAVTDAETVRVDSDLEPSARERLDRSVERAEDEVADAEQTVALWEETGAGRLGWETVAPCLADALEALAEALQGAEISPPAALDQAAAMAGGASDRPCRTEAPP